MESLQHPATKSNGLALSPLDRLRWGMLVPKLTKRHPGAMGVGYALMQMAGRGRCWPAHQKLADLTGYGVRTVQDALRQLIKAGLVQQQRRFQTSSVYWLTFPPRVNIHDSADSLPRQRPSEHTPLLPTNRD